MAYIATDKLYVFPSVQRNLVESRSFTEENVANLIYNFIDNSKAGFVITDTYENSSDSSSKFEFNINGYYFRVTPENSITALFSAPSSGDKIFASISFSSGDYKELEGTDSGNPSTFSGVAFEKKSSSEADPTGIHLKLLEYNGSNWIIPEESKVRFKPSNVGLDEVDGGQW